MFVNEYLICGILGSVFTAQGQNSTTTALHHEISSDLKISTQNPLHSKFNSFSQYDFNKTFGPLPSFKFDISAIKPMTFENRGSNSTRGSSFYRKNNDPSPTKDEISNFFKELPSIRIDGWEKLGEPNFKLPVHTINLEGASTSKFSVGKYGGIAGGIAGIAASCAACAKLCGKKFRNKSDCSSNGHDEEEIYQTNNICIDIPENSEAGQTISVHSNNTSDVNSSYIYNRLREDS